jgi:UDP-N-acetylmuramoyl-L-alanyl-D-glutamate--2,6-diaminopimelate ligase
MGDADAIRVQNDSRAVRAGDVFVAVRGISSDGHDFVGDAVARGAVAVVSEKPCDTGGIVNVVVSNSALALAELSAAINGNPGDRLRLVGATGTNGKTSTTHLIRAICQASSWGKIGLIGTVGHGSGDELESAVHTTPEPIALHRLLADMGADGCVGVVMEVSSHAVRQQRIWGLDFEIGMLTNVTRDHLDYHPTFEDYVDAKREFCYSLVSATRRKPPGTLIYSQDDNVSREIGNGFPGRKCSVSIETRADVFATNVDASLEGTAFDLHLDGEVVPVSMRLLGRFSAANGVMAAAAAQALGINNADIKSGLEAVSQVPGRFEALGGGGLPVVIVDYSHTPDSLRMTLEFCRGLGPNRLIVVFGCGGDRDRGKRPLMGEIAQAHGDICYVTNDNPRTEDPNAIIEDILKGMDRNAAALRVDADRRRAIKAAIGEAGKEDLVAICGKGHEDYQVIGMTRHHFDDREEAKQALDGWSGR